MTNDTSPTAQVLTGAAAVLQAIAWPMVAIVLFLVFRTKLSAMFDVLRDKLADAKRVKAGGFELEAAEKGIQESLTRAGTAAKDQQLQKDIPENQIQAAREIREKLQAAPITFAERIEVVHKQIYDLVVEYERIRKEMEAGPKRTRTMNEITAKMRALAFAAYPLLPSLITGDRVGERLAAICILQVVPELQQFEWLIDQVKRESQAFVLFHAALAILKLVQSTPYLSPERAKDAIRAALNHVESFRGGKPDQNTIDVLNRALLSLKKDPALV